MSRRFQKKSNYRSDNRSGNRNDGVTDNAAAAPAEAAGDSGPILSGTAKTVAETGVAMLGPALQKVVTHGAFKFTRQAGLKSPVINDFLRNLGQLEGIIDALPGGVNLALHKLMKHSPFGSEIINDEFCETVVRLTEGFTDAVRDLNGMDLKKVSDQAAEIAKKAMDEVAKVEFFVDAAGFGHRADCPCAKGLDKKMSYEEAATCDLKLGTCCKHKYQLGLLSRVLDLRRNQMEPLEVLGYMPDEVANDFLRWIKWMRYPEYQALGMHCLVDLSSSGEINGFMRLDYPMRFEHMNLLKAQVERRLGTRERFDQLIARFEAYDNSLAQRGPNGEPSAVEAQRQHALATWAQLQQPAPFSLKGVLGLA